MNKKIVIVIIIIIIIIIIIKKTDGVIKYLPHKKMETED